MTDPAPMLLIKGDATEEEVAAVLAVLQGLAAGAADRSATPRRAAGSAWAAPARAVRTPLSPGPSGWRASGLPR